MKAITLEQTPSAEKKPGLQWVPIELIVPSTTNPRVTRTAEKDQELLESVRERNVTQAGLIRPVTATKEHIRILESFTSPTMGISNLKAQFKPGDDIFQLIGGQRRWEASVKSGKLDYPAQIRAMADGDVLEYQVIENDDREDLHDMDRGAAYRRLYEEWKKDTTLSVTERVKALATRMKRKPRTVWNLISLGNLTEQGQRMLREGVISQSHAYEICSRPRSQQNKILNWVDEETRYGDSSPSVRDLKDFIREECDHYLESAPFPTVDASLVPAAGPCTTCPKNTAVNPNLVDEEEKSKRARSRAICTDNDCYGAKVEANLVRIQTEAEKKAGAGNVLKLSTEYVGEAPKGTRPQDEWKEVTDGSCKYTALGVIVDGEKPGSQVVVCAFKNLCKTHWGPGSSGESRREPARPRSEAEKKAMLQKQRNRKLDEAYRSAATAELRKKVTTLKLSDLQEVAAVLFERMDRRLQGPLMEAMGWTKSNNTPGGYAPSYYGEDTPVKKINALKPAELSGFIALVSIADNILPAGDYYGPDSPIKADGFAKRHKVDLKKIHATAAKPLQEKWAAIDAKKKTAKLQTSAKKKGKA